MDEKLLRYASKVLLPYVDLGVACTCFGLELRLSGIEENNRFRS
jgi:hypothetical protein